MNYDMQCQLLAEGFKHEQIITEAEEWEKEIGKQWLEKNLSDRQIMTLIYKYRPSLKGTNYVYSEIKRIKELYEKEKNARLTKVAAEKSKAQLVKKNEDYRQAVRTRYTPNNYEKDYVLRNVKDPKIRKLYENALRQYKFGLITEEDFGEVFTEGVKDVITKKVLPALMMAGYLTLGGKVVVDQANKSAALMQQVTDAEFNSGVYSFNFKGKNYKYNEKNNTVTIDGKTRKINVMDKIPPRQAKYSQERYGYMHEGKGPTKSGTRYSEHLADLKDVKAIDIDDMINKRFATSEEFKRMKKIAKEDLGYNCHVEEETEYNKGDNKMNVLLEETMNEINGIKSKLAKRCRKIDNWLEKTKNGDEGSFRNLSRTEKQSIQNSLNKLSSLLSKEPPKTDTGANEYVESLLDAAKDVNRELKKARQFKAISFLFLPLGWIPPLGRAYARMIRNLANGRPLGESTNYFNY